MSSDDYFTRGAPRQPAQFSPLSPDGAGESRHQRYSPVGSEYDTPNPFLDSYGGDVDGAEKYESHKLLEGARPRRGPSHPLQTKYSFLSRSHQSHLGHDFRARDQRWRLTARTMVRFFITFATCAGIVLLYKLYERKGVLTRVEKRVFNALNIGTSLILGMNVVTAFKIMAGMVKWKILSAYTFRLREVDLILSLDSFQSVFEVMRISTGRPLFCFGALLWIFIGLTAQVVVALLGLSQEMTTKGIVQRTPGPVWYTDMSAIYPPEPRDTKLDMSSQQFQAHFYGALSTYFPEGTPGAGNFSDEMLLEHGPGENDTYWKYYFREKFFAEETHYMKTDRSITVTSQCEHHPIVQGQYARQNDRAVVVDYGSRRERIDWVLGWATRSTVFVNPGWDDLSSFFANGSRPCGHRCSRIYVFQFADQDNPEPDVGHFYNCTINISPVTNVNPYQPFHSMPDKTAIYAAGAIGLSGYIDKGSRQFVRYTLPVRWASLISHKGSVVEAERLVGRFAAGVIAAYDEYGPFVEIMGIQEKPGVALKVNWMFVLLTLGSILAMQLTLGALAVYSASSAFCKDASHLSTARLLRPIVERLGPVGSASSGIDIAMTFGRAVRYGIRSRDSAGKTVHHLDIGEDIEPLEKFPDGYYD